MRAPGIVDPRHLYRLRRESAERAAREEVARARGEPATAEDWAAFDAEVRRLVEEWTAGWEGSGLPRAGGRWGLLRRALRRRGPAGT